MARCGDHRSQRCGQEYAAENPLAHHQTDIGRADIYGRVGSLLEVGTGFHPELTGRENIFLNGAVLGMNSARHPEAFRQDCRFCRSRAVSRYARQALQ